MGGVVKRYIKIDTIVLKLDKSALPLELGAYKGIAARA